MGMISFSIATKGNLQKRLDHAMAIFPNEIQNAVNRATDFILYETMDTAPTAFGNLKDSMHAKMEKFKGTVAPTVNYAVFVHEGTKPHWVKKSEWADPSGAIYLWAQRKGINPFLVARAIARKGTKAQPWMRNAFEKNQPELKKYFEDVVDKLFKTV